MGRLIRLRRVGENRHAGQSSRSFSELGHYSQIRHRVSHICRGCPFWQILLSVLKVYMVLSWPSRWVRAKDGGRPGRRDTHSDVSIGPKPRRPLHQQPYSSVRPMRDSCGNDGPVIVHRGFALSNPERSIPSDPVNGPDMLIHVQFTRRSAKTANGTPLFHR